MGEHKLEVVTQIISSMAATLNDACGTEPDWLCRKVFEWTNNSDIAGIATWLVDRPVKVVVIFLLALLTRRLVHKAIDGLIDRLMSERSSDEQDAVQAAEAARNETDPDKALAHVSELADQVEYLGSVVTALVNHVARQR